MRTTTTKLPIPILVISLESDYDRRVTLRERFPRYYPSFQFIWGIDLRNRQETAAQSLGAAVAETAIIPLSLTERGCALSHLRALSVARRSTSPSTLILEDDVIGCDTDIDHVIAILDRLPQHHFLLAGGQEALRGNRYLYGKKIAEYFQLPPVVYRFTARTCCYAVSPSMARIIHNQQRLLLERADDWKKFLKRERNFFFTPMLKHPVDLGNSHIEASRSKACHHSTWMKARNDGLFYTLSTQILKVNLPWISRLRGWTKIHFSK